MADPTIYADRYEIVREIARGGMANVYLARDTKLDRAVALKVLPAELSRDPSFVERFRLEAQAAASLNDPTIVAVYDWGQEQETSFIVMEYVEGRTLRDVINHGTVAADQAAQIGADIAKALAAAHRAGVVHRDIKPGNVLITPTGQVKVTDFGIARANGVGDGLTRTGAVMGTATYFSPEQAQGLPVDARSDIYSLGVVLYEMVTGAVPFAGDSAVSVAYLHVREPVKAPSQRTPDLPPPLETIILTCLAKDPNERYQSADELRADLLRFRRGQAVIGGPATAAVTAIGDQTVAMARTSVAPIIAGTSGPARPKSRGPVALVIAFLVALIGVVAFLLIQVFNDTSTNAKTVTVKSVIGQTEAAARKTLEGQGFKVTAKKQHNSKSPGTVFDQSPQEGEFRKTGTVVTIFVSDGDTDRSHRGRQGRSQQQGDDLRFRRTRADPDSRRHRSQHRRRDPAARGRRLPRVANQRGEQHRRRGSCHPNTAGRRNTPGEGHDRGHRCVVRAEASNRARRRRFVAVGGGERDFGGRIPGECEPGRLDQHQHRQGHQSEPRRVDQGRCRFHGHDHGGHRAAHHHIVEHVT